MRKPTALILLSLTLALAFAPAAPADPPAAPAGWTVAQRGVGSVYTPDDLPSGETYEVAVFPTASLGGLPLGDALTRFSGRDAATLGTASGTPSKAEVHASAGVGAAATQTRQYVTAAQGGRSGEARFAVYFAFSADGRNVTVMRVVCTAKTSLFAHYAPTVDTLFSSLTRSAVRSPDAAPAATPSEGDGAEPARGRQPQTPAALVSVGGPIKPGRYVGDYVLNGEARGRRTIYLYANGDYRLLNGDTEPPFNTGKVGYAPGSGMMMINKTFYDLFNERSRPAESYCFYGREADGTPCIYAHRGYPTVVDQVLRYAGPPDRPSPTELADRAARAEAVRKEAERYKFVTTPNKGIQESRIAGAVMHFEMGVYFAESNMDTSKRTLYLLLKDGTYHEGLPVAPCVIDEAVSRRKETEAWGTWKHAAKPGFLTLTPNVSSRRPLTFEAVPLVAARPADLQGHYGRASSTGSILGGGSVTQYGVTFGPGGRFRTDSSFSFSNGSVAQSSPFAPVMVFGGADAGGAYVSASGGGATVTEQQRKANRGGGSTGTYELRGYSLILHYDDGVTEYTPCYFETPDRQGLRFRGGLLFRGG